MAFTSGREPRAASLEPRATRPQHSRAGLLEARGSRPTAFYNLPMPLIDQIQKDIVAAMKAREEHRLSTLRMVKTALKNREIEKMAPLDDKESQQVLSTLIKQRMDSVEQFTKGGRQEMADKEAA